MLTDKVFADLFIALVKFRRRFQVVCCKLLENSIKYKLYSKYQIFKRLIVLFHWGYWHQLRQEDTDRLYTMEHVTTHWYDDNNRLRSIYSHLSAVCLVERAKRNVRRVNCDGVKLLKILHVNKIPERIFFLFYPSIAYPFIAKHIHIHIFIVMHVGLSFIESQRVSETQCHWWNHWILIVCCLPLPSSERWSRFSYELSE